MDTNFIGRPPDPDNKRLICPRCHQATLCKSGFRKNIRGENIKQAYVCKTCYLQTTKPVQVK